MSKKRYVLHDPLEPGFYLSEIRRFKEGERMIVTTASEKLVMRFVDKDEVETLAGLYDLEVEELEE